MIYLLIYSSSTFPSLIKHSNYHPFYNFAVIHIIEIMTARENSNKIYLDLLNPYVLLCKTASDLLFFLICF